MNKYQDTSLPLYVVSVGKKDKSVYEGLEGFEVSFECISPAEFSQTIKKHVMHAIKSSRDFIILSNGNHQFCDSYCKSSLISNLKTADEYNCDILCGGFGRFGTAVPVNGSLLWIDYYSSCNFVVLYRSVYEKILKQDYIPSFDSLSSLTISKMIIYPFISIYNNTSSEFNSPELERKKKSIQESFTRCEEKLGIYLAAFHRYCLFPRSPIARL